MPGADGLVVALFAAGASTRFGAADKLAVPLAGKPLLHWAAETGRSIHAAQHLLVTSVEMPQQFAPPGYLQLVNADAAEGLASSLRLAAGEARRMSARALLVLLGDMPLVRTAHLAALIAAFEENPSRPVFSRAPGGSPQPPTILPAGRFAELEALGGDQGARALARGAAFVEARADTLVDVDHPADLALCARLIGP